MSVTVGLKARTSDTFVTCSTAAARTGYTDSFDAPAADSRAPGSEASDVLRGMLDVERQLHTCTSVAELFGQASEIACDWCGFSRAFVVSVDEHDLTANASRALDEPASDVLRRRLLAEPIPLVPGSLESELVRLCGCSERGHARGIHSQLQASLGLKQFALGAIAPEMRVLAMLVADRPSPVVDSRAVEAVNALAHVVARLLERLFLKQRMNEFAAEMRHLTASALALIREGLESPISLPTSGWSAPVFAFTYPAAPTDNEIERIFTRRELDIIGPMMAGLSNRDIATQLQLSPETVKKYVARVLRKLGAANRADAAVKYLRLSGPSDIGHSAER